MKEALSCIASAWSWAFIVAFGLVSADVENASKLEGFAVLWLFLMVGAVTGAGWLAYRWQVKSEPSAPKEGK